MFAMGIDIGYSNLKIAYGETDHPTPITTIFPAGSAPKDNVSPSILSGHIEGGFNVQVNGDDYVAGIEQSSIDGWERILSADYPFSDDYKALFYAALLATKKDVIDFVVTGLPVDQAGNEQIKTKLETHLVGTHNVGGSRKIKVNRVKVIPQPVGAYLDYLMSCKDPKIVQHSRVLVIDPGFFSVDYCAIDKGNFDKNSADSSQDAMSVLLEEAGKLITVDYGRPFDLATLEHATRGDRMVPVFGEMVDLGPYLSWASGNVAETVMRKVRQNLRRSKIQGADFTLLTGGGAHYYQEAAAKIMDGSKVVAPQDPVTANARGFFHFTRG